MDERGYSKNLEQRQEAVASGNDKSIFWETIFSVLGTFDIFSGSGRDPLLRSRRELVVQIFRLIDYPENLAVSVAALHVIADMCESPAFAPTSTASPHKIYSILESAGELEAVMEAFVRRLEREETEQVSFNSAYCFDNEDYMTTSLSDETFMNAFGLSNLIRLQILDFLVKNVVKPGYNIAHYLLGFGVELISGTATSLKAPPKDDTTNQFTTLHLVLELLSYGLGQPSTPIVALDHPSLGNACYKLLETLLMTPGLRKATAVYLRNEEEAFIPRQAVLFSRYPVDSEDLSYTVFECYQKKHLFAALVHDLHSAIIDDGGCWSYVLRTADALISTKLSEKQSLQSKISDSDVQKTKVDFKPENGTDCAILDHLIAAEGLIADSKSKLESPENEQVLEATGELIVSLTQLIRILLSPSHLSPNILPYDREKAGELQCKLSAQILPVLSRLLGTHEVKSNVLDAVSSCALLCLSSLQSLNDDFGTLSDKKNKETFLAGDELPSLAHAALSAILQPTISSPSTRSHAYAILMSLGISSGRNFPQKNIKETMQKTDAIIERMFTQDGETIIQRKQIPRLIEIVGIDATESSIEYAGCKTLALDFITNVLLNSNIEAVKSSYSSLDHAVVERLVRLGLLKGIVSEIKFDDRVLCSAFKSIENNSEIQDLNPIYLFSARVALLSRIAMIGGGGIERLVESGLPDTLISLKLLPLFASHLQAAKSDDPNQLYLIHLWATSVICPLVRLVRILSNINISQVYATSFLRTHHTVLCSLIRNLQDPLDNATLISDSIYLLASLQDSPHDANLGSLSETYPLMLYVIIKCLQTIDSENGEKSGGKNIEIKKVDKSNIKDLSLFSIFSSVFNFCSKRVILDQKLVLIDSEFNNSDDQQSSLTSEDHAAESGIIPSPVYLRILEWLCNFSSSLTIEDKSNYDCNVARQVILIDQILLTMTISLERKIQQGVKEPFQRLSRSLTSSQSFPLSVSLSTLESWLLTVGVSIESVNRVRSSALQKIVKTRQMLFSDPVDSIPGPSQMSAGNRPDNEILTKSGGERNVFLTSS